MPWKPPPAAVVHDRLLELRNERDVAQSIRHTRGDRVR